MFKGVRAHHTPTCISTISDFARKQTPAAHFDKQTRIRNTRKTLGVKFIDEISLSMQATVVPQSSRGIRVQVKGDSFGPMNMFIETTTATKCLKAHKA